MSARRPATLLELAVVASVAVLPLLLVALLAIVGTRDDGAGARARQGERHVSVRHVAALKAFEHAIVRRDRVAAGPPSAQALVAGIPQCAKEWSPPRGVVASLRALALPSAEAATSPASRLAAQLAEIDRGLMRMSAPANRRVAKPVGLDGGRWIAAVQAALASPIASTELPERRFPVGCADIALAVRTLARSEARMLATLAWEGTETARRTAHWRADQVVEISPRQVARANPWAGLPGCVYLGHADGRAGLVVGTARSIEGDHCARDELRPVKSDGAPARVAGEATHGMAADDPRWKVPPSLGAMLRPLEPLVRPATAASAANRIELRGNAIDVGHAVDLTIDPDLQALAQRTAACYTGRDDLCRAFGIRRAEDGDGPLGAALLETAMVRMAAIAVIDIGSGRIEALAGELSPCARDEHDGPGRSARCDSRLPYPIRYRPDALLNPAVFHDAMPASTIKPIMAAAFLSDPDTGARWLAAEQAEIARAKPANPSVASLRGELMRSDSARFLDRMFCADRAFGPCARPWAIQAAAASFGWNAGCTEASERCGRRDVLFGAIGEARVDAGTHAYALEAPYGRLLVEPLDFAHAASFRLRAPAALDAGKLNRCSAGPDGKRMSRDDWGKCSGGALVDVVAEGWGQGHARASAIGAAGMMGVLASAANGQDAVRRPHLVDTVRGVRRSGESARESVRIAASDAPAEPHRLSRDAALVILDGLTYGHRAGTSRRACEQVYDAAFCARMDWIAGKTGTPTFHNDERSLDDLRALCAAGVPKSRAERDACGPLRPYKWYVAAYRTDPANPRWTKAIGVLVERNWIAGTGRVHGASDRGPNPAAEIAMQIAGRHAGSLPWEKR